VQPGQRSSWDSGVQAPAFVVADPHPRHTRLSDSIFEENFERSSPRRGRFRAVRGHDFARVHLRFSIDKGHEFRKALPPISQLRLLCQPIKLHSGKPPLVYQICTKVYTNNVINDKQRPGLCTKKFDPAVKIRGEAYLYGED